MKKILKIIGIIILCIVIVASVFIYRGIKGHGTLNFLSYLAGPFELTDTVYEVQENAIEVVNDNETIRGKMFIPDDGADTRNVVILSHGFNCACNLLENKAKSLAASGVATVVFDFRGGSHNSQSDGTDTDMTVYTEISDLNAVIDYVKQMEWFSEDGLFLMGESFGGMVSALTAAERNDVSGLILCFPALHSADSARENWESVDDIPETLAVGNMTTSKAFWETLWNLDIFEKISSYTGRVIIFHGTSDPNVDYHYSIKANEIYENSELFLVEGAEHCFGGDDALSVLKSIYYFVEDTGIK